MTGRKAEFAAIAPFENWLIAANPPGVAPKNVKAIDKIVERLRT